MFFLCDLYFIRLQCILTAINNAMAIIKKANKIYKFFEVLFVGTVFIVSIIS